MNAQFHCHPNTCLSLSASLVHICDRQKQESDVDGYPNHRSPRNQSRQLAGSVVAETRTQKLSQSLSRLFHRFSFIFGPQDGISIKQSTESTNSSPTNKAAYPNHYLHPPLPIQRSTFSPLHFLQISLLSCPPVSCFSHSFHISVSTHAAALLNAAPPPIPAAMASMPLTTSSFPLPSLRLRSSKLSPPKSLQLCRSSSFNSTNFRGLKRSSSISSLPSLTLSKAGFNVKPRGNYPCVRASASGASVAPAPAAQPWQGAAIKPLLACIATGVILWFVPVPSGVSKNAWQLLAIFLATIVGIITQPLPLGAVAVLGLGVSVLTKTLTFAAAFSGFGDPIPWLICLAFFFARGFIKTGLGNRIAYQFVYLFGSSSLGLGYSLVFSEALLAPAIPSVSARAGGIFLPIVKSLCGACGSNVGDGTENRLGAWLMLTCFQTSVISSAMFLTGMAANPLCATLTQNSINQTIGWLDWAKAGIVPGLVSLIVVPFILYVIYPPTVKSSPDAPKLAREKLQNMGPMTANEKIMAGTLLITVHKRK